MARNMQKKKMDLTNHADKDAGNKLVNNSKLSVKGEGENIQSSTELRKQIRQPESAQLSAVKFEKISLEGFPDFLEARVPGSKARRALEELQKKREDEEDRINVIRRYGSEENVLSPIPEEITLQEAVSGWIVFCELPYDPRLAESIDGKDNPFPVTEITPRVRHAITTAIPIPTTITEAHSEYQMWSRRDRDLCLALGHMQDSQLDLPAQFRQEIVRDLLEIGLRARNVEEVLIRLRFNIESEEAMSEIEKALLLDLENLVAQGGN